MWFRLKLELAPSSFHLWIFTSKTDCAWAYSWRIKFFPLNLRSRQLLEPSCIWLLDALLHFFSTLLAWVLLEIMITIRQRVLYSKWSFCETWVEIQDQNDFHYSTSQCVLSSIPCLIYCLDISHSNYFLLRLLFWWLRFIWISHWFIVEIMLYFFNIRLIDVNTSKYSCSGTLIKLLCRSCCPLDTVLVS